MSWPELSDKFRHCARLVLPNNNAQKVIELVAGIEQLKSLNPLFHALTGARGKSVKKTRITKSGSEKWSRTRKASAVSPTR